MKRNYEKMSSALVIFGALVLLILEVRTATIPEKSGVTEYYTAFLNISYFDKNRGVYHTEKTETGRYSTTAHKNFHGAVVPLMSNWTVIQGENESIPDVHFETTGQ